MLRPQYPTALTQPQNHSLDAAAAGTAADHGRVLQFDGKCRTSGRRPRRSKARWRHRPRWNSTLEEVAAAAGFTKGAVYYHFKSKEHLLLQVLETIEARSIDATIAGVKQRGGSPTEQLASLVKHQTQWAARHPEDRAVMILMSVEVSRAKSKIRTQMFRIYHKLAALLEAIIDAGKSTGEFSTRQATRDIVLYLEAVHDGNILLWYRSGNDPDTGRKLTRATLNGFAHAVQGT
jgi:AcrR family transcriptional regulator